MCKASELRRSISPLSPELVFLTKLLEWGSAASWPCSSRKNREGSGQEGIEVGAGNHGQLLLVVVVS